MEQCPPATFIWELGCTGEFGCDCPSKRWRYGVHGTRGRYSKGCRCDRCTAANTAYMRRYRKERGRGNS